MKAQPCSDKRSIAIARKLHSRGLASRAKNSDTEIAVNEGLSYLPYQKAGIEYMSKVNNCLLADDQGLGKTIQICGLINHVNAKNILIVCPSSLKQNWKKFFLLFILIY